jgi:hypothetical protein
MQPSGFFIMTLFGELDHHIRNFDILLRLVLSGHFEDNVLLVLRDGLFADMLHELAHTMIDHVSRLLSYGIRSILTAEEGDP